MKTHNYNFLRRVNFIVRTDANKAIGYGHFFRTLVLAEKLTTLGATVQYLFYTNPQIATILKKKKIKFHQFHTNKNIKKLNTNEISWFLKKNKCFKKNCLIVDHPLADENYLKNAKNICDYLVVYVVDHLKERYYYGDILINQNYKASKNLIKSEKRSLKLFTFSSAKLLKHSIC